MNHVTDKSHLEQQFVVLDISREELIDMGLDADKAAKLTDQEMQYIAGHLADEVIELFGEALQEAVQQLNDEKEDG